jgi:serine/threonine protein phosphatase PrpC
VPIAFRYAARSDVGLVRSENQDSGYAGPHLLVVADGMGGHAGGDIASSTVIGHLVQLDDDASGGGDSADELAAAIARANRDLQRIAAERAELTGMGTTVTALLRSRNKLLVAHIGDSRAYLWRGGQLARMTTDHSFVQTLIDQGRITPEQASTHPQRSLVTRVLTGAPRDVPDVGAREALRDDRYLLCSDGLSGFVADETIGEILATGTPDEAADKLVELAPARRCPRQRHRHRGRCRRSHPRPPPVGLPPDRRRRPAQPGRLTGPAADPRRQGGRTLPQARARRGARGGRAHRPGRGEAEHPPRPAGQAGGGGRRGRRGDRGGVPTRHTPGPNNSSSSASLRARSPSFKG